MGIIAFIIVIWALANGSVSSLLWIFGIIILIGLLASNPILFFLLIVFFWLWCFLSEKDADKKTNNGDDEKVQQSSTFKEDYCKQAKETNNTNEDKVAVSAAKSVESGIKSFQDQKDGEIKELNNLINRIKNDTFDNSTYASYFFRLGTIYEHTIKDYFRACCCIYLATTKEPKNKEYQDNYLRLCKLVEKDKGLEWLYYVTLINEFDDIERYINQLLQKKDDSKKQVISKTNRANKVIVNTRTVNTRLTQKNVDSKFEKFSAESYLHSLGYKVGKTGLTSYKRKMLLEKAITSGTISKYEVIATLERNISMFSGRSDRQQSVKDWYEDLNYIKNHF